MGFRVSALGFRAKLQTIREEWGILPIRKAEEANLAKKPDAPVQHTYHDFEKVWFFGSLGFEGFVWVFSV